MMRKFLLLILLLVGKKAIVFAQIETEKKNTTDTSSFKHFLETGKLHITANSFLIATDNENYLSDYYAFAAGAGFKYESGKLKGFQIGGSGFFTYNILSSDLAKPDSITGQPNRYEILMLDIQNPSSHSEIKRLEELYLKYNFGKSFLQVGKIILSTPFINKQEGKMRPTTEEGVWTEINEIKNLKIETGWLWSISPRGTSKWFSIANSVGIYPTGVNPDGTKSKYYGNIKSNGVGLMGLNYQLKNFKLSVWDNYFENVMNSSMIQLETEKNNNKKYDLFGGIMFVHQQAVNNGGNVSASENYILPGSISNSISGKIGFGFEQWTATANYTHITGDGRYLNPREWGYDPFYTFLQRELNEGFGKVNAATAKLEWRSKNQKLRTSFAHGRCMLPDVKNYRLNKYGMPSYQQFNLDFKYSPKEFFNGFSFLFLIVYKNNTGEIYNNEKYVINKVNMINYNFALDYTF